MIAEADRFVKRKIRKRRQKALTAENYGGTLFHGENMPSNRISPILDGIRQTIAVTVKLRGLFGMLTMPLNSHLDYEQWYPHITNTMLTNTLRDLETLGIVNREQFNEIPPHAEYSLTEKGRGLLPVFFEISKWGEHNLDASSPAETDNTGAKFPQR